MKVLLNILGALTVLYVCSSESHDELQQRISKVLEPKIKLVLGRNGPLYQQRLSEFRKFVEEFERNYETDNEIETRFDAFVKNMETSDTFSEAEESSAQYGMTQFSDFSEHELRRIYGGCKRTQNELSPKDAQTFQSLVDVGNNILYKELTFKSVPKSYDWRQKSFVGPVLDQGYCASSWAYAATASLETAFAVETKKFVRLAKQQLIDCDAYNYGCCGGRPHTSFFYLHAQGGLELDKTYNGRKFVQRCHFKRPNAKVHVVGITLFGNTSATINEQLMEKYVAEKGTVAININPRPLIHYKNGIIKQAPKTCERTPDFIPHSVALVGFGEEGGTKYWIVKNSFGPNWGEKGYFRIERGANACGLAYYGVAPVVKPAPSPPHPHNDWASVIFH